MAETKRKLGRGLNSLLSSTRLQELDAIASQAGDMAQPLVNTRVTQDRVMELPIEKINRNPYQPRQNWDEGKLYELAESIKANGLIQPILVRPMGDGYQLVAGERRMRATQMAGKGVIAAIVKQADEAQMLEWSLIENIHRADLNSLERARAYHRYIDSFSLTQQEAAGRLGEDRSTIANYIRLLELPARIKEMLTEGVLSMGHGRVLLGVDDPEARLKLAERVGRENISVRQLERMVQQIQRGGDDVVAKKVEKSANVLDLEREMTRCLGTKVSIKPTGKKGHRGRIIIEYYSLDDFERIREKIG
jgi:ParB family chromosome partitioning protein